MIVDRGKKAKRQGQIGMKKRYKNERESGKKAGQRGNEDRGHGQEGGQGKKGG
jgi:hypothetical protein